MGLARQAGRAQLPLGHAAQCTARSCPCAASARYQRCQSQHVGRGSDYVPRAAAASAEVELMSQSNPSSSEMWDMGFADCESDTCGLVPDGSLVLVPVGAAPAAREDRIAELEHGVQLDENTATVVGAVGSKKVNFVMDIPVVSAQHARIEGVLDESPATWSLFGQPQSKVKYFVTDLTSTNGTFVNRGRLRALMPVEIKPGDIVAFGAIKNAYRVVQAWARKDYKW